MVVNSTNINKKRKHPSIQLNSLNTKRPWHVMLEIEALA